MSFDFNLEIILKNSIKDLRDINSLARIANPRDRVLIAEAGKAHLRINSLIRAVMIGCFVIKAYVPKTKNVSATPKAFIRRERENSSLFSFLLYTRYFQTVYPIENEKRIINSI